VNIKKYDLLGRVAAQSVKQAHTLRRKLLLLFSRQKIEAADFWKRFVTIGFTNIAIFVNI
jgi:hypothetical protein